MSRSALAAEPTSISRTSRRCARGRRTDPPQLLPHCGRVSYPMMRCALGLVCAAAIVLGQGSLAAAATITPTTFADQFGTDQGACALREAVQAANTDAAFGGCPGGS